MARRQAHPCYPRQGRVPALMHGASLYRGPVPRSQGDRNRRCRPGWSLELGRDEDRRRRIDTDSRFEHRKIGVLNARELKGGLRRPMRRQDRLAVGDGGIELSRIADRITVVDADGHPDRKRHHVAHEPMEMTRGVARVQDDKDGRVVGCRDGPCKRPSRYVDPRMWGVQFILQDEELLIAVAREVYDVRSKPSDAVEQVGRSGCRPNIKFDLIAVECGFDGRSDSLLFSTYPEVAFAGRAQD